VKAWPELGQETVQVGLQELRDHGIVRVPVLGFIGLEGQVPAATCPDQVAGDLDHGEVAPPDRPADEESDHKTIPVGDGALERVGLVFGCLHQLQSQVDELRDGHHAAGLSAAASLGALQPPDDSFEPSPVTLGRHRPDRVQEVLGVVEDAGGGDLGIQMI
jgi:hypothetical protein